MPRMAPLPGRCSWHGSRPYTSGMTTTIKVSTELRDRLKAQAARAGRTLGAHLSVLADAADRQERLAHLKVAIAETSRGNAESYAAETRAWETAELSDQKE